MDKDKKNLLEINGNTRWKNIISGWTETGACYENEREWPQKTEEK